MGPKMIRLFISLCILGILQGLEVIPEKPEVEYINTKYIKEMKFTIQRKGRGSPYYIHFYVEALTGCGNNLTIAMKLYESVGGNYLPTGIQGEYKICDFLEHEPYLGKMFMVQVQQRLNSTCPFKAGSYQIKDLVINLEDFPFNIPFTWSPISVRTRSDVVGYHTDTKEPIFRYNFQFTINQKPRNKKALEVIPEKPEVLYANAKYVKDMKFTIHRKGRGSPYYINFFIESLSGCGNNATLSMKLYEYLGGNYVPLGVQGEYKLCDFLENEPYLGKMFMNQINQNYTCPFKAGKYHFDDIIIHLEDFPFNIPFTWASITVRTMCDVSVQITETKEPVFRYKFHFTLHQKPKNKSV